ncbi:MAG: DUF1847 domain-containing protein [Desulfofustis sp.]|nr:DUF1847 domain-containing protein [Desulfofustis sp.]
MSEVYPQCARCPYKPADRLCRNENGKAPDFCPTRNLPELCRRSLDEYESKPEVKEFARQASIQEGEGYLHRELGYDRVRPGKTRIEEVMEFAARMNYRRLGLAFCIGLRNEAKAVEQLIVSRGFEMVSAICKVGRTDKQLIGIEKQQQIDAQACEAMCNPILQAMVLNDQQTDFNILLGLCVGHDSMFFMYSKAPCTVLAVKDRVLGHNPLAAVYNLDSYYRSLK